MEAFSDLKIVPGTVQEKYHSKKEFLPAVKALLLQLKKIDFSSLQVL